MALLFDSKTGTDQRLYTSPCKIPAGAERDRQSRRRSKKKSSSCRSKPVRTRRTGMREARRPISVHGAVGYAHCCRRLDEPKDNIGAYPLRQYCRGAGSSTRGQAANSWSRSRRSGFGPISHLRVRRYVRPIRPSGLVQTGALVLKTLAGASRWTGNFGFGSDR
jgi:hypothetical protein